MARFSDLRAQVKGATIVSALTDDQKMLMALMLPAVFIAMADGDISAAELDVIAGLCSQDQVIERCGSNTAELFVALKTMIKTEDPADLIANAAGLLDAEMREHAIKFALRVARADGDFDVEERGTLMALAKQFGMSSARYAELLNTPEEV